MAELTFSQHFNGYWREPDKSGLPKKSGVYCVYECTFNEEKNTVTLQRLIYIGECEDINDRISCHEKLKEWIKYVRQGNELCYSYTEVNSEFRERVEAAFINMHKPPVNTEYKDDFPFDKTSISTSGRNAFLNASFVVNRK